MFELGLVTGIAIYAAYLLWRSTFRVEEGYLAVLVAFGKAAMDGKRLRTHRPGLHWKKPWERAVTVSMKEQTLDLHREKGGGSAMAADGTVLRLDSFVRYAPVEKELYELLFGLERPVEHITGLFTCLLRNEIGSFRQDFETAEANGVAKHVNGTGGAGTSVTTQRDFAKQAGSYALIRRERRRLNERIESFCREKIDDRYGIHFNAVDLADILPPDELADALNAIIQAQSEAETHLHRAEADCQQRVLAAERGLAIASVRAQAIEVEIRQLGAFFDELDRNGVLGAYVARRRAEVMSESKTLFFKEQPKEHA